MASVDEDLWTDWGFDEPPEYLRVLRAFRKLEDRSQTFVAAVGWLQRKAIEAEPRVACGEYLDSTAWSTHAALVHVCPKGQCPSDKAGESLGKYANAPRGRRHRRGSGTRRRPLAKITPQEAGRRRNDAVEQPDKPELDIPVLDATDDERRRKVPLREWVTDQGRLRWYDRKGHLVETRDVNAGPPHLRPAGRAGQAVAGLLPREGHQLLLAHPQRGDGHLRLDQRAPDRQADHGPAARRPARHRAEVPHHRLGYAIDDLTWWLLERGVQHRHPGRNEKQRTTDRLLRDRHGVERCEHCGGVADTLSYYVELDRYRYVRVGCRTPIFDECEKKPYKRRAKDDPWCRGPLHPTDPLYLSLVETRGICEGVHGDHRARYGVAGLGARETPAIIRETFRELISNVAVFVDWLRACVRNGYVKVRGGYQLNDRKPVRVDRSAERIREIADERLEHGLDMAYGPAAAEHGLGPLEPQSARSG